MSVVPSIVTNFSSFFSFPWLQSLPQDKFKPLTLGFSAKTSANMTQDIIDGKLDKRRKGKNAKNGGEGANTKGQMYWNSDRRRCIALMLLLSAPKSRELGITIFGWGNGHIFVFQHVNFRFSLLSASFVSS